MSLYELACFEDFVCGFSAVTLHDQWHARVAKVGPRFFAALGHDGGLWAKSLIFKTTPFSYQIMRGQNGIKRAPYTQSSWLAVDHQSELSDEDLKLYITQSYEIVVKGLTKNLREELGIGTRLESKK